MRRKLLRNVKTGRIMGAACLEFRGENFRGWLKNREIRELPQKFPATRYEFFLGGGGGGGGEHHSLHSVQAHQRLSWPGQAMCSSRKLKKKITIVTIPTNLVCILFTLPSLLHPSILCSTALKWINYPLLLWVPY